MPVGTGLVALLGKPDASGDGVNGSFGQAKKSH